jgi:hypothetical protein
MKPRNLKQVFRLACVWALSVVTAVPAQNLWHPLPTESSRTTDTDIVGATVDAVATRGGLVSKARVVVSGQKRLGTALVGIWVEKLNTIISDDDLWPYTGPPLGTEAKNPHVIEITLVSSTGKFLYSSRLVMLPPESFPKGVADGDDENLFATNNGVSDERFKRLITKMNSGFDQGVVTIGRGVFSPPIVVKFPGNGVEGLLMPAMTRARKEGTEP